MLISHRDVLAGHTCTANVIDYGSTKVSLTTTASYDSELHAAQFNADGIEALQFGMMELTQEMDIHEFLSLPPDRRFLSGLAIDAKGLYTRIENAYKTERRGGLYVRKLVETLVRSGTILYWINGGHMIADALTKVWERAHGELLLALILDGKVRLTYCEESWRRELAKRQGNVRIITMPEDDYEEPPEEHGLPHLSQMNREA